MSIRSRLSLYYNCIKRLHCDVKQLAKGQKSNYELLQLSHRLEKGLLIRDPKPLWGWEKAYRIVELLKINEDDFSTATASAVLSAYLTAKESSSYSEDREKGKEFINSTHFTSTKDLSAGGTVQVERTVFSAEESEAIEKLFNTRHSCRDFSDKDVSNDDIAKGIQMALRCPSACNRQPFKVYVIDPPKLEAKWGKKLQYKANKILVVSGDVRAFTGGELLDWFVSPSIFAGYLTLSLHALGIGSCVVRKDLVKDSSYNKALRELSRMTDSERIVLELCIGYYNDIYHAPVSNRASVDDIVGYRL